MSYLERMRAHRQAFDFGRQGLPSSVSTLTPIPRDSTQALYNDKMNEYRDKLAEDLTAPFTTVGGVDLLRRGINKIPAIQDIKDLMDRGGKFAEKVKNFLGSDDVRSFTDDPEGYLRNLAGDSRDKLVGMLNDGINEARGTLNEALPGVGDAIENLGRAIPTTEDAIRLGETSAERIGGALSKGIVEGTKQGLGLAGPAGGEEEDADTQELREAFEAHEAREAQGDLNPPPGGDQPDQPTEADLDAQRESVPMDDDTEVFHDAVSGEPDTIGKVIKRTQADFHDIAGSGEDLDIARAEGTIGNNDPVAETTAGADDLSTVATAQAKRQARRAVFENLKRGIGEGIESAQDTQQNMGRIAESMGDMQKTILGPKPEADEIAGVRADEQTADRLGEASTLASEEAGSGAGADGMSNVLKDVAGEGLSGEEAGALGVADAIPVLGTIGDLASIGAIVGEAVDYYNNKKKEEQDASALAQRQSAIEKDITQEQSEIVGQARQSAQQDQMQQAQVAQAKVATGIPIAQVGAEPV